MDIKILASGSKGNAYIINDGESSLLLDAGLSYMELQRRANFKLSEVSGCLISHEHGDHIKGAAHAAYRGIDIYASAGTLNVKELSGHRFHPVAPLVGFDVGTFRILPFDVQHDAAEPLGFLIESSATKERLLYVTDSYYVKYKFKRLHYLMIECNYDEETLQANINAGLIADPLARRLLESHMSLEHLMDMLKANDLKHVKQIYLLHLSDTNSDALRYQEAVQKLTGAEVYVC